VFISFLVGLLAMARLARRPDKATGFFERHDGKVVTIARSIEGLRPTERHHRRHHRPAPAKVPRLQRPRHPQWVTVWTSVGYLSGNHINTIYNTAKQYELYFAIAVGALLIAYIARRIYRSRKQRTAAPTADKPA
jgi:membrane protein DedA with SNARE-associated domain